MNSNHALAARIAALESLIVVLITTEAIRSPDILDEARRLIKAGRRLSERRLKKCQDGPEKDISESAIRAFARVEALAEFFLTGKD
ncbi:hypothetical protein [Henriciella algicola]|uniref:Uncharacterized protein n=1 Tax=Henriciella algicola TaxID=1608422 RepID=A0A399RDY4_9PROT|nr:hypothetical protein [Henriciella algicola]RIJ29638.1 hypothetical protein D1222_09635 [Henriciella algicola]